MSLSQDFKYSFTEFAFGELYLPPFQIFISTRTACRHTRCPACTPISPTPHSAAPYNGA